MCPLLSGLVDLVEDTLQTAVQTAVKREDEQEFAPFTVGAIFMSGLARKALKIAAPARATYETAFPIKSAAKFSTWRWISPNCRLENWRAVRPRGF